MSRWHLYLVRCADGALYTGIATDVARRVQEHQDGSGRGAKSLRGRGPLRLVFAHPVGSRSLATRLERRVKRLPKRQKEALVSGDADISQYLANLTAADATSTPTG